MACFEGERGVPSQHLLRQGSEIKEHQEITSFPCTPIPSTKTYPNNYYLLKYATRPQHADVVGVVKTLDECNPMLESSLNWNPVPVTGQRESFDTRKTTTSKIITECVKYHDQYNRAYLECCCAYPCCEISNICQRNLGSVVTARNTYIEHLKAVNGLLVSSVARMARERDDEESTSRYEGSGNGYGDFVGERKSQNGNECRQANIRTMANNEGPTKSNCNHKVGTTKYFETKVNKYREHLGEKRKHDVLSQDESFESQIGKRFRPQVNITDNVSSRQYRPTLINTQVMNERYSNRFAVPVTTVTDVCKLQSHTVLSCSQKDFVETKNNGEGNLRRQGCHGEVMRGVEARQRVDETPPSRNRPKHTTNEQTHSDKDFGNKGNKFISLDSTKSSFLTLMNNMRKQLDDVIPCPYCQQKFGKYADLKIHVQTHLITPTSAGHETEGKNCQIPAPRKETKLDNGRLLPGISTSGGSNLGKNNPGDKAPNDNTPGDNAKTRATSVIMFVGQKTK